MKAKLLVARVPVKDFTLGSLCDNAVRVWARSVVAKNCAVERVHYALETTLPEPGTTEFVVDCTLVGEDVNTLEDQFKMLRGNLLPFRGSEQAVKWKLYDARPKGVEKPDQGRWDVSD